jgi:chromosomal replication initiation ATPase DnaA
MRLLTEEQFNEIKAIDHFETYQETVKSEKNLTLEQIAHAIYRVMIDKLPYDWAAVNTRTTEIMYARHYGRYIAYMFANYEVADITRYFGARDHSVIYNSIQKVKAIQLMPEDNQKRIELNEILALLSEQSS